MKEIIDKVTDSIKQAPDFYYRLIIIVGPPAMGKTRILEQLLKSTGAPVINVNQELARQMLELTERQRMLSAGSILTKLVDNANNTLVLLDNTEILFDVNLKLDPIRLLQGISRDKTIVAAWNGRVDKGYLYYADYEHPEYKKYAIKDFVVINLEDND